MWLRQGAMDTCMRSGHDTQEFWSKVSSFACLEDLEFAGGKLRELKQGMKLVICITKGTRIYLVRKI